MLGFGGLGHRRTGRQGRAAHRPAPKPQACLALPTAIQGWLQTCLVFPAQTHPGEPSGGACAGITGPGLQHSDAPLRDPLLPLRVHLIFTDRGHTDSKTQNHALWSTSVHHSACVPTGIQVVKSWGTFQSQDCALQQSPSETAGSQQGSLLASFCVALLPQL